MPPYMSQLEESVFQSIVPQLEAEGFSVFVQPSKDMLPPFLRGSYRPDAIAYKGDRKLAIEVMSQLPHSENKVRQLREIFSKHPEWEIRLIYASPRDPEKDVPPLSREVIEEHLRRIEVSLDGIGATAALLTAWAAFEAAARRLNPAALARPQSPARLVETLASDGYVTPDEADVLRRLGRARNEAAHGRLDLAVSREQVESLIAITRTVLRLDG